MKSIKEILKNYYPNPSNNPGYPEALWETVIGQRDCARRMRADFIANKNLYVLNKLCLAFKRNYMPDDVVFLLKEMGINTWGQLNEWLTNMNLYNPKFFLETLSGIGKIDINLFPISQAEVNNFLQDKFPDLKDISYKDDRYQLTDEDGLLELMNYIPSKQYDWIKESEDCDDIVRIARGWLSENNIGNLTIADCEINCYFQNSIKYAHNILLAIVKVQDKLDIRYCEPQNGHIWKMDDQYQDISIDHIQVRKLIF